MSLLSMFESSIIPIGIEITIMKVLISMIKVSTIIFKRKRSCINFLTLSTSSHFSFKFFLFNFNAKISLRSSKTNT